MYVPTLVYIFGITRVISALQNNSVAFSESHAVVKVRRGQRKEPDRLTICSKNADALQTYFNEAGSGGTFVCKNTGITSCQGWPTMKKRYLCSCKDNTQTFAGSRRECVSGNWLRQGCSFRFGSWRYSTGWNWNRDEDPLLPLYLNPGFALTGSFNVPTRDYRGCYVVNMTSLNMDGGWEDFPYDTKTIRFYKLHNFFQISWSADKIDSETSSNMSGRIFRLYLSCELQQVSQWDPLDLITSCLVFEATGNISFVYNKVEPKAEKSSSTAVGVALGVTFGILLLITAIFLGIFLFRRRRGEELGFDLSKARLWCRNRIPCWKK